MSTNRPTNAVLEAMATAPSMRHLTRDEVDDELVDALLFAATRASNPGNSQPWDFVVVRSPALRTGIADAIAAALGVFPEPRPTDDPVERRTLAGARHLITHLADAPVIILVCGRLLYPTPRPSRDWMLSACYAASQNLLVAARSLGLGASFTTLHALAAAEVRALVGIPDDVEIVCTVPVGWPARPFGEVVRRPLAEVVHRDRW
jgi:nitroreductase